MTTWRVRMAFEGDVDAPSASHALAEFKAKLGLPPASMRPEAHMTECSSRALPDDTEEATAGPDVEEQA